MFKLARSGTYAASSWSPTKLALRKRWRIPGGVYGRRRQDSRAEGSSDGIVLEPSRSTRVRSGFIRGIGGAQRTDFDPGVYSLYPRRRGGGYRPARRPRSRHAAVPAMSRSVAKDPGGLRLLPRPGRFNGGDFQRSTRRRWRALAGDHRTRIIGSEDPDIAPTAGRQPQAGS